MRIEIQEDFSERRNRIRRFGDPKEHLQPRKSKQAGRVPVKVLGRAVRVPTLLVTG